MYMYVCIYAYIHVYVCTYAYIYMYVYIYIHMYICVYVDIGMSAYVCTRTNMCRCVSFTASGFDAYTGLHRARNPCSLLVRCSEPAGAQALPPDLGQLGKLAELDVRPCFAGLVAASTQGADFRDLGWVPSQRQWSPFASTCSVELLLPHFAKLPDD